MILVIDHYDSFTYNLVQALGKVEKDILVRRHDELSIEKINQLHPEYIIISSGPGRPASKGVTSEAIQQFKGKIPILGVGLGCHAIAETFGGKLIKTDNLLPGKSMDISHDGKTIFSGIEQPFSATRYHSLIVSRESLPDCLVVSAWSSEEEVMAIRHRDYPLEGLQFNPESIMTEAGERLLKNFIELNRMAVN
ncbi:anthranilate synthase component II [Siminovitchia fortis]|uniref:Aminodeoxychorismate/anthranilate synthase component II n=1 Tax=Siminovitchia fortis TaxID=254758 RepID=A0A443IU16_9BACI|nr:aminodeoxychorismate/anthranilate synthase component II [Siminovitchia fortis]RWR11181.1 aminodeoxychorismate/anthranilate synthase component II [Siminovitchia fortis]WHY80409.1 aminodeoxychorismate/anthranilate synthase component II [Siminovitchia fortis]